MKLKALYNAVITKVIESEESTFGNIVIPDLGNEVSNMAVVIDSGPGLYVSGVGLVPNVLKPGDKVVLPTMGFTKFEFMGEEYLIGPENSILCVIE
jgi:co-chaperonin GroES (HSP10)